MVARNTPYVGLVPYAEEDHELFFGRDRDESRVIANMFGPRLTLLYGPSGVGKSSLLNAGVVHKATEHADMVAAIYRDWSVPDPMTQLVEKVSERLGTHGNTAAPDSTGDELADQLASLADQTSAHVMVILDQFEEYFMYVDEGSDRGLTRALAAGPPNLAFLVSIREDSLALIDRFKGHVPGLFDNYLRIDHLDRESARQAIEGPLDVFRDVNGLRYEIEPKLVDKVLDDLEGQQLSAPGRRGRESSTYVEAALLQLVMNRLFEEETSRRLTEVKGIGPAYARRLTAGGVTTLESLADHPNPEQLADDLHMPTPTLNDWRRQARALAGGGERVLRRATYTGLRGTDVIVLDYLDRVMADLDDNEQRLADRVFKELVTATNDKVAHRLEHLVDRAFSTEPEVESVIKQLEDERVLRMVDAETRSYEVFHDLLARAITEWRAQYQKDIDPLGPAKQRLQSKLERSLVDASSGKPEQQLAAISRLDDVAQNEIDDELRERAVQKLRDLATEAASNAPREPTILGVSSPGSEVRKSVQEEAEVAIALYEVRKLGLSISSTMDALTESAPHEFSVATGTATAPDRDSEAFTSFVEELVKLDTQLQEFEAKPSPAVRRATEDLRDAHLSQLRSLRSRLAPNERLTTLLARWEGASRVEARPASSSVKTSITALVFVGGAIIGALILFGSEWLTDWLLSGRGRSEAVALTPWVLGAAAILMAWFAAWLALDDMRSAPGQPAESTAFGLFAAAVSSAVLGVVWVIGNAIGLATHNWVGTPSITVATYIALGVIAIVAFAAA